MATERACSHSVLSKMQNALGDFSATEHFLLETPLSLLEPSPNVFPIKALEPMPVYAFLELTHVERRGLFIGYFATQKVLSILHFS